MSSDAAVKRGGGIVPTDVRAGVDMVTGLGSGWCGGGGGVRRGDAFLIPRRVLPRPPSRGPGPPCLENKNIF